MGAAGVSGFVECRQYPDAGRERPEVVPFVDVEPSRRDPQRRGVVPVRHVHAPLLRLRVPCEPRPHQRLVPRPVFLEVARRVDPHECAPAPDALHQPFPLARVELVGRRVQEYHHAWLRRRGTRERRGVFRVRQGKSVGRGQLVERPDAGHDGRMVRHVRPGIQEDCGGSLRRRGIRHAWDSCNMVAVTGRGFMWGRGRWPPPETPGHPPGKVPG